MTKIKFNYFKAGIFGAVLFLFSQQTLLAEHNPSYAADLITEELLIGAHTVVRNEEFKVEIPSFNKVVVTYKSGVTLLNDNSKANQLVLSYNSFKKINKIKGRIYDAAGKLVRELKKSEIEDWSAIAGYSIYEDSRVKAIEVDYSHYPYTVEFEYKLTISNSMFYPDWYIQDYSVSVEKASYTVQTNDKNNFNYKAVNIELTPTEELHKGKSTYHWSVSHLPAIKRVSYSPDREQILPMLLLVPKKFKLGKHEGSMASWKFFGAFMTQLNNGRDVLSDEMASQVKSLTTSAQTDREKIDILYRYLQENTRYVNVTLGVGGWQTFDADYVEKNKYGDCKALTYFMKAMLKSEGIMACPVLINSSGSDALIEEDFVYPGFNHVVLNIPSENYWLECTSSYGPPNYVGSHIANRKALRITEQGGELVQTPAFKPEESKISNKATITLEEDGSANIVNIVSYTGPQQDNLRYMANETTMEEQHKWLLNNSQLPTSTIYQLEIKPVEDKPEVKVEYNISTLTYASKSGKRLFVPINLVNPFTSVPGKEDRKEIITLKEGYVLEDEVSLLLPEGYKIESMPEESILLESPYGKYTMTLISDDTKIIYKRRLEMLPLSLPAEAYEDFRNFRKEVAQMDGARLVLVKKKT